MTVNEARYIFKKNNPDREIVSIWDYKGDYMIVAPDKKLGEFDDNDPFFIVSSKNGAISLFSPVMDFDWVRDKNKKQYF